MGKFLLVGVGLVSFSAREKLSPAVVGLGPFLEERLGTREGCSKPQGFLEVLGKVCIVSIGRRDMTSFVKYVNTFVALPPFTSDF